MENIIAGALQIVNRTRAKFGASMIDRLPKGLPASALLCPLANCLPDDAYVSQREIRFASERAAEALAATLNRTVIHDPQAEFDPGYSKSETWAKASMRERRWALARPWVVDVTGTPLDQFVMNFDRERPGFIEYLTHSAFEAHKV